MSQPSRVNPEVGMQLARSTIGGDEVLSSVDDTGSAFWVIPKRELAIVEIAGPGGGPMPEIPSLVLAALRPN